MRVAVTSLVCLSVAALSSRAEAQSRGLDIEHFSPALDGDGFLGFQGSRPPGPGRFTFGLWSNYSYQPLVVTGASGEVAVIRDRLVTHAQLQVGIGGRLALALEAPIVTWQGGPTNVVGPGPLQTNAFGDPRFVLRYRLLGESAAVERERSEGPGLAILAATTLPVGQEDAFAGEGSARADIQVIADFHVLGAGIGAMLGHRQRFDTRRLLGVDYGSELTFAFGLKVPLPWLPQLITMLEVRGATGEASLFQRETSWVELDLGFRYRISDVTFTGGIGRGLTAGVGEPAVRGMLGLVWAPRVHDQDHDRILDDQDACPPLPEDYDNFQDSDGCPDPDNDNDLIPDADDRCPNDEAAEGQDEDEDGCTDPAPAADEPAVDPNADTDGDGVLDASDACPSDAEDADGFEDDNGCPDVDDDADEIADANDACPRVAEDRDGVEDTDGCPEDNDGDGVADADDRCADQRETINGVTDEDGCPDRGRAAFAGDAEHGWRGNVRFVTPTAGAQPDTPSIDPRDAGAVAQLAQTLRGAMRNAHDRVQLTLALGAEARGTALVEELGRRGVNVANVQVAFERTVRGAAIRATLLHPTPAEPDAHPAPPAVSPDR